jgi:hypothetical protein
LQVVVLGGSLGATLLNLFYFQPLTIKVCWFLPCWPHVVCLTPSIGKWRMGGIHIRLWFLPTVGDWHVDLQPPFRGVHCNDLIHKRSRIVKAHWFLEGFSYWKCCWRFYGFRSENW